MAHLLRMCHFLFRIKLFLHSKNLLINLASLTIGAQ